MTLPNITCQTLGGKYFWETLANSNGWKLQKDKFTNHYRTLDTANIRQSWSLNKEEIWHIYRRITNQQANHNVIEH